MVSRKWKEKESPGVTRSEDVENIEMTWDDFGEVAAEDRGHMWKSSVSTVWSD